MFEIFARIVVGAVLKPEATSELHRDFVASIHLEPGASADEIYSQLRLETARHKLHEPDRVRYERALEDFIDRRWDVDSALGGLSPDGLFEPRRGYVFVGVRVEGWTMEIETLPRGAAQIDRPQWLRKGDLSVGSELAKSIGEDARKPFEHACRAYARATREIVADATARVRKLAVKETHAVDWALCRWAVPSEHPAVHTRHGRQRD